MIAMAAAHLDSAPHHSASWFVMTRVSTPCIALCMLDLSGGFCLGCGRSKEEIAHWSSYSEDERVRIMQELPARGHTPVRRRIGETGE